MTPDRSLNKSVAEITPDAFTDPESVLQMSHTSYSLSENVNQKLREIALKSRSIHGLPFVIHLLPPDTESGSLKFQPIDPSVVFADLQKPHNAETVNNLKNPEISPFRILELGSGWGEFCTEWMLKNPEHEYIALEIKADRIKNLSGKLRHFGIQNARILPVNFNWFLSELFTPNSFDLIVINFPDPWPKKRHWKHRLIQSEFPEKISKLLRPSGKVYIATDYGPYARKIISVFRKNPIFTNEYPWPDYLRKRPDGFPKTKFENIHLALKKRPYYTCWRLL
jgi:tRNA (guanine-N7-)-methyltransferase